MKILICCVNLIPPFMSQVLLVLGIMTISSVSAADSRYPTACQSLRMVNRQQWNGHVANNTHPVNGTIKVVHIDFTDTNYCFETPVCSEMLRSLQKQDLKRKMRDIRYSYLLDFSSNVYVGRGFKVTIDDLDSDNLETQRGARIGLIGKNTVMPPPKVWSTLINLIQCGIDMGVVDHNFILRARDPCDDTVARRLYDMSVLTLGRGLNPIFECLVKEKDWFM